MYISGQDTDKSIDDLRPKNNSIYIDASSYTAKQQEQHPKKQSKKKDDKDPSELFAFLPSLPLLFNWTNLPPPSHRAIFALQRLL